MHLGTSPHRGLMVIFAALSVAAAGAAPATAAVAVLDFESVATPLSGGSLFSSYGMLTGGNYGGFAWDQAYVYQRGSSANSYSAGVVSGVKAMSNNLGNPLVISRSERWDLVSAYITPGFASGLQLRIEAFDGSTLTVDRVVTLGSTAGPPSFVSFNIERITSIRITPLASTNRQFIIDDLAIVVPAPGALALVAVAGAARSRRRNR